MASKIEQIIEEMERYLEEEAKPAAFSSSKVVINRDEFEQFIEELKVTTPEEIRRYQKIISNRDAILKDAKDKADKIIAQAQVKTDELVSEHQIMQQAYAQANQVVMIATKDAQEMLDNATNEANQIKTGAIQYTDDLLNSVQAVLTNSIDIAKARNENFISKMQDILDQVVSNRAELAPEEEESAEAPAEQKPAPAAAPAEKAEPEAPAAAGEDQKPEKDSSSIDVPEGLFKK